jgi:hypothetical protein
MVSLFLPFDVLLKAMVIVGKFAGRVKFLFND